MISSSLSNNFQNTPAVEVNKKNSLHSAEAVQHPPSQPRQGSDSFNTSKHPPAKQTNSPLPSPSVLVALFSSLALVGVGLWQHKRIGAWLEEAKSHFASPKPIEPTVLPEPPVQPLSSTHSSNYRPSPPSLPSPPPPTNALETANRQILKRLQTYITNHKSDKVDSLNAITENMSLTLEQQIAEARKLLDHSEADRKVLRVNALQQLFNPANPLIADINWEAYLEPTVDINTLLETTQDAKHLESYLIQLEQLRQRRITDSDILCKMMTVNTLPNKDEQRRTLYNQLEVKDRDSRIADYQRFFLQWAKAIEQRFKGELHNGFPAEGATVQVQNVPTQWPASLDWGQTEAEVLQNCVGYLKAQPDNESVNF